jgi:hypothetical protein
MSELTIEQKLELLLKDPATVATLKALLTAKQPTTKPKPVKEDYIIEVITICRFCGWKSIKAHHARWDIERQSHKFAPIGLDTPDLKIYHREDTVRRCEHCLEWLLNNHSPDTLARMILDNAEALELITMLKRVTRPLPTWKLEIKEKGEEK